VRTAIVMLLVLAALGCADGLAPAGPDPSRDPSEPPIEREPIGPIGSAPARRVRRMTAEQWNASLSVATGQVWEGWEESAAALGRPDFTMTTEEGEQMSVVFEQLSLEAARATCNGAVTADRAATSGERPILGTLDLAEVDPAARLANLRRLLMRFHGHDVASDEDARMTPWRSILEAPIAPGDLDGEADSIDEVESMRWEAICIGLATHPDFLTY
jgi:hypothetical protein